MWVTSLQPVRKKQFELFFYTHQLYVIFIVFLALHIGDFIFSMAAGAVFLFMLDRFLRFCQSRTKVDLISASCRPCGTVELTFSKPASKNNISFIMFGTFSFSFSEVGALGCTPKITEKGNKFYPNLLHLLTGNISYGPGIMSSTPHTYLIT
jgi:hypothetical protein